MKRENQRSVLLTLRLAFSLLPTAALADGEGTQTNDVAQIGDDEVRRRCRKLLMRLMTIQ